MRSTLVFILLLVGAIVAFCLDIALGSVTISWETLLALLTDPSSQPEELSFILWQMRLPNALTAVMCGAGLAVSGLAMQTLFRNPLADASILGVSGGASLGVALFMMGISLPGIGATFAAGGIWQTMGMLLSAVAGAAVILLVIALLSRRMQDIASLLIVGVMISFLSGAVVGLLQYYAPAEVVKQFQVWSLGSLEGNDMPDVLIMACTLLPSSLLFLFVPKQLDALLIGERYAASVGVSVKRIRLYVILAAGVAVGVSTAYCGPIAFIGIAVPHIVRFLTGKSSHRLLIPFTLVAGAGFMPICHMLTHVLKGGAVLPINMVTGIIGAPILISLILRKERKAWK